MRVRALLVVAVLAVAGMIAFVLVEPSGRPRPAEPGPRVGNGADPAPADPLRQPLPRVPEGAGAKDLDAFVAACAAQGEAAVPGLLRLLRQGADRQIDPRWVFAGGRTRGYPTLRAAYIAALRAIPGDGSTAALREVLAGTKSVEETYLLALALEERAEKAFVPTLLERVPLEATPALLAVQWAMVEMGARLDPLATAARLEATAPRGEDGSDPQILSRALGTLPIGTASATVRALLLDGGVTPRGKSRYLRTLLARPEIEALQVVEEVAALGQLQDEVKTDLLWAAAESDAFRLDAVARQQALAERDDLAAKHAWDRFQLRLERTTRLLGTLLGVDVATSDDPRAVALRKKLEAHRAAFPK
jgi:hypothetical protein